MRLGIGIGLNNFRKTGTGGSGPIIVTPADYVVTSDAEWTALMLNSAATLSGKTAEITGALGAISISGKAFPSPFVVRGGVGGSIRRLTYSGTVANLTVRGLSLQMTGWPKTESSLVYFDTGTYSGLRFEGCTFRHGYGASLVNFDPAYDAYPENVRPEQSILATATSVATALPWNDPARTSGHVEFFNEGAVTVYVAVGGSSVVATTGSTSCAAGINVRVSNLNPTTATHIAVLAASGTAQTYARPEIGMTEYLADAFGASSSASLADIVLSDCECSDVSDAFKGIPPATSYAVLMDSRTRRVFQDQSAMLALAGSAGKVFVLRNSFGLPFSRQGIARGLLGDARDPHGDTAQSFGNGSGTIGPMYFAGNRQYMQPVRTGCSSQGLFISDNDAAVSYDKIYSISDTFLGGAPNGMNSGEAGFPTGGVMIYGATVVKPTDITTQTRMRFEYIASGQGVYIGKSVSVGRVGIATYDQSIDLTGTTDASTVFSDLTAAATATTRGAMEAALTTVGAAAGMGAAATADAVDWTTTDHTQVIKWANIPSGAKWDDMPNQSIGTVIALPLRRILNERASQTVVPGVGVSWRSVATDGVTEVQAWTTSSGTIEPHQFIQIRKSSSAVGNTAVTFSITINGFTQITTVTTVAAAPAVYHTQSGTGPYFRDPANAVPANTTRMEWKANFYPTSIPTTIAKIFSQESTGCDIEVSTIGDLRLILEDGDGTSMTSGSSWISGGLTLNIWQELELIADHTDGAAYLRKNGVLIGTWTWVPTVKPYFQTGREISFFGNSVGANPLPSGWQVEYGECYFTTGGVRSLRKRIDGNAATVNADSWKGGGSAT